MRGRFDRWTVLVPVGAVVVVCLVYLLTHPYPARAGGLYLAMAEGIAENGYRIPDTVPHYTAGGIPFAYPPLVFYVVGVLQQWLPSLQIARLAPVIVFPLAVAAYFVLARTLLRDSSRAAFAAVVVATSPAVLQYTITAGGFVRTTALLLSVVGLVVGVRIFRDESWLLVVPAAVLFGLTVLTHPKYALFFGVSYLSLFVGLDRSIAGALRGSAVAVGGLVVAAPWWYHVGTRHGFDVFVRAGSTHGGVGSVLWMVEVMDPLTAPASLWPTLVAVSGVYLLVRGQYVIPGWLLAVGFLVGNDEHVLVVGGLAVAVFVFDGVLTTLPAKLPIASATGWRRSQEPDRPIRTTFSRLLSRRQPTGSEQSETGTNDGLSTTDEPQTGLREGSGVVTDGSTERTERADGSGIGSWSLPALFLVAMLVVYGVGSASVYVAGTPSLINDRDVEAMTWVQQETAPTASFVVIGDVGEWFPLLAERTSLVAPRGSEWERRDGYGDRSPREYHMTHRNRLYSCLTATCLTHRLRSADLHPEFVYVSHEKFVDERYRTLAEERWQYLRPSLSTAAEFDLVFENSDVLIYRYHG